MLPTWMGRASIASPFDALWNVRREVDQILNEFGATRRLDAPWSVPAEVLETGDDIRFHLEVPGVKPEDLNVSIENNVLTVSGEKKVEKEAGENEGEYHVLERRYGRFERSFRIPSNVQADAIRATYENGVLSITLPKTEESRPRRIPIQTTDGARQLSSN